MGALIRFKSDELEALREAVAASSAAIDARRAEALRRAQWKLDEPRKSFGKPKAKPARDLAYLRWIRRLPCLICQTERGVEAAHTGPRGLSQLAPDRQAIPLCREHHRTGLESYHKVGPWRFARIHRIEIGAVVARLNAEYGTK